jgi:hypothetical protein
MRIKQSDGDAPDAGPIKFKKKKKNQNLSY